MRLALGTAIVLGLAKGKMEHPPTTAHILVGRGCPHGCAYCGEGNSVISRIKWPEYGENALDKIPGKFERACLQVAGENVEEAVEILERIGTTTPASVCVRTADISIVRALFSKGADRVCIPLDAATREVSERVGRGNFDETLALLQLAAREFPGRITTHLIIGLGESESEAVETMKTLKRSNVTMALFAFSPVEGTPMERAQKPEIGYYRRTQIAHWLVDNGEEHFEFNSQGELIKFPDVLPEAFVTSGCAGCNRPYFDSSPSEPYNFPCPLAPEEHSLALEQARVWKGKSIHKAEKLLRISLEYSDRIRRVRITGDFFMHPEEGITGLEKALEGCPLDEREIEARAAAFMKTVEVFGFDEKSLAKAIIGACG